MEIINACYYSLDEDAVQYSDQSPVVRRPISANPSLHFNLGFFFFCSKVFSTQKNNFPNPFWSIQSSNCRQKELNLICFLSFHI